MGIADCFAAIGFLAGFCFFLFYKLRKLEKNSVPVEHFEEVVNLFRKTDETMLNGYQGLIKDYNDFKECTTQCILTINDILSKKNSANSNKLLETNKKKNKLN